MFLTGKLLVLTQEPLVVNEERKYPEHALQRGHLQTSLLSSCVVRTQDSQLPGFAGKFRVL